MDIDGPGFDFEAPSPFEQELAQRTRDGNVSMLAPHELAAALKWMGTKLEVLEGGSDCDTLLAAAREVIQAMLREHAARGNELVLVSINEFLEDHLAAVCQDSTDNRVLRSALQMGICLFISFTPVSPGDQEYPGITPLSVPDFATIPAEAYRELAKVAVGSLVTNPASNETTLTTLAKSLNTVSQTRATLIPELAELFVAFLTFASSDDDVPLALNNTADSFAVILSQLSTSPLLSANRQQQILETLNSGGKSYSFHPEQQDPPSKRQKTGHEAAYDDVDETDVLFEGLAAAPFSLSVDLDEETPDGTVSKKINLSRAELNDVLLESLQRLAFAEPIQTLHLNGLRQNLNDVARRLQMAEIKALNALSSGKVLKVESEGNVPCRKLLSHADAAEAAMTGTRELLHRIKEDKAADADPFKELPSLKAAFESIAEGLLTVPIEGKGPFLHATALFTRLVAQANSAHLRTIAVNTLIANITQGNPNHQKHRKPGARNLGANPSGPIALELTLQLLYTHYATLAPFDHAQNPSLHQQSFETTAESLDTVLSHEAPAAWLFDDAAATPAPAQTFSFSKDKAEDPAGVYCSIFADILKTLDEHDLLLQEQRATGLTLLDDILVSSPAIPKTVWELLDTRYSREPSGDKAKVYCGVRAVVEVIKHRPATRNRALGLLLHYAACPPAKTQCIAINFLVKDIFRHKAVGPTAWAAATAHCKHALKTLVDLPSASSSDALEVPLKHVLTLYLALCTKDTELFAFLFDLVSASAQVKSKSRQQRGILSHPDLPRFVKKLGTSPALRAVAQHPKNNLSLHILKLLIQQAKGELAHDVDLSSSAKAQAESDLKEVESACWTVYNDHGDIRGLILLLSLIPRTELKEKYLPRILSTCRKEHVSIAIKEAVSPLASHYRAGLGMSPGDVLSYLHALQPSADGLSLKHVVAAIDGCLIDLPNVFTAAEVARALQQLLIISPLPIVLMRSVMQAVHAHPALLSFILSTIVPELFKQKIWELDDQILWKGFIKLVQDHQPKTLDTLLLLPES
eukprot:gene17226-26449_t